MAQGTILVVEDERVVALDIQRTLTDLGFEVVGVVGTGEDAVKRVEEDQPDLVLMDIRLGGEMDGIATATRIRDRWGTQVIYLTAHSDDEVVQRAKVTEPLGFIIKPFDERALFTSVETALFRLEAERLKERGSKWMADWRQDMERMLTHLKDDNADPSFVPVSTFVNLTLRNVVSALSNIQQLTDAMAERAHSPDACQLMQCPRRTVLEAAVRDTVETLEATKGSFKSKELGHLRRRLEHVLARTAERAPTWNG